MRIAIAKEAFNRKMSLLTSKLDIELKKKLVRCYVWSIDLYGSEIWTLTKYLGSVLTRDGHCTREIKMRIAIAKEAFNGKMTL